MEITEVGCEGMDWIQLSLSMWSSGFHKRQTISWSADSLPDSQEEVFSKKFISYFINPLKHTAHPTCPQSVFKCNSHNKQ
jgi:hypothetical protein